VRGPGGSGLVAEAGLSGRVLATVHTCGKALASAGAFVCGSQNLRTFLINKARTFIFNTALPPYFASQVSAGMKLAKDGDAARIRLVQLSDFLRRELRENGFYVAGVQSQIVPIVLGLNDAAMQYADFLRGRGFGVRAIRPPTVPEGKARLRISVTAKHSEDVLAEFVFALVQARNDYSTSRAASVSQ
jgi:8-amino-7-oxononanoate synthase